MKYVTRPPRNAPGRIGVLAAARSLTPPPTSHRVLVSGGPAITPQVATARRLRLSLLFASLLRIVAWDEPWDIEDDD